MDVSKILFNFLKTDGIKSDFEELDINGDGKINGKDKAAAQNNAIAQEIQSLLNSVDPEPELTGDEPETNLFANFAQVSLNNLQSEIKTLEDKIEEKEEEYEKLSNKIEEKQEEYENLTEQIEETKEGDDVSSLKSRAEGLASEIRILGLNLTTLVSTINTLEAQYSAKQKQLETQQAATNNAVNSASKAGSSASAGSFASTGSAQEVSETSSAADTPSATTTPNPTPTTQSTASQCDGDVLYDEEKGVNIGKVADLIWDTYAKVYSDSELNEKFQNSKYYSKRYEMVNEFRGGELGFAINYLFTEGTPEQQNAIKGLVKDSSIIPMDMGVNDLFSSFKERIPGGNKEKRYSKDAFIKKFARKDVDGDGFITQTEKNGRHARAQNEAGGKWLTSKGKLEAGHTKIVDSENRYKDKEIPPADGISKVDGVYTTTLNGKKIYGLNLPGHGVLNDSTLNFTQSELEKLNTYFTTAGDNASIDDALKAMGITSEKTSAGSKGNKYTFKGESGLESVIKVTAYSDNKLQEREKKFLEILKAMSLGASNGAFHT